MSDEKNVSLNFLEEIIENDLKAGTHNGRVLTRFPPEPNGYLHIGHAKSICLNFGLADKYGGKTNLRFDDTNPVTEEVEYVDSIKADIKWLGFEWDNEFFASDYFDQLIQYAVQLIQKGLAYVDDSSPEEIAALKGSPTVPGQDSPYRNRSIEENLSLFNYMKEGKYPDGSKVLRARVDMASPNMLMRDPVIYRIKHAHHHRTGDKWCIYPMYDFAHGQSDSIENITHSVCTLEFIHHRPLYNWFIEQLDIFPSKQYEFARLNLTYTVMSKRRLLQLVNEGYVEGWDDPRMPTISGLRRRGYTAASIRDFATRVGIAKRENVIDLGLLEFCVREDLNKIALRRMVVLNPLKITITNLAADFEESLTSINNPEDHDSGSHDMSFSNELYIEHDDFRMEPEDGFFRLSPGKMVRLKNAYIIVCDEALLDGDGDVVELKCRYFAESKSGQDTSGIKVKSVIHWVNSKDCVDVEVKLYDKLFTVEDPQGAEGDFKSYINENSLQVIKNAKGEKTLMHDVGNPHFQFMRLGYFYLDKNSTDDNMVFNRTVSLKDSYKKK
ncbi:MAG: glutamine--tRNA ligase/YqeY domain fusion protein [Bacteroidetes bacterium]|jgi:glutaminyl-tRNA synthetase|nr:glutamine--tRNA ligase/YqeY domain fusion protein [Bacteroidota bacterium]